MLHNNFRHKFVAYKMSLDGQDDKEVEKSIKKNVRVRKAPSDNRSILVHPDESSGHRERERPQSEERVYHPVGVRLLEDRLELPPDQLVLWLMADRGVAALLSMEQVHNTRIILMLLSAVKKATEAGRSENLTELLIRVRDSNIFKSLSVYLNSVSVDSNREQTDMEMLVDILLFLLEHYMLVLPTDSQDMVSLLALVLESRILGLLGLERQNYHLNRIKERVSECRESRSSVGSHFSCEEEPKEVEDKKDDDKYGKVVRAKVVTNARTPEARSYGYVPMNKSEDANKCIHHDKRTELHERMITVERAKAETRPNKSDSNSSMKSEKEKEGEKDEKEKEEVAGVCRKLAEEIKNDYLANNKVKKRSYITRKYTTEFKDNVVQFSMQNTIMAASKKFQVPLSTAGLWVMQASRRQTGNSKKVIQNSKQRSRKYKGSDYFYRKRVVEFCDSNGWKATTKKFQVSKRIISIWAEQVGGELSKKKEMTKSQILKYAVQQKSWIAAARKFGTSARTISYWGRKAGYKLGTKKIKIPAEKVHTAIGGDGSKDNPLKCDACGVVLSRDETVNEHIVNTHMSSEGLCGICGEDSFDLIDHFKVHLQPIGGQWVMNPFYNP